VRARLNAMSIGQKFHFICDEKMAAKIERVITLNDGEIIDRDSKSCGIVISIRKKTVPAHSHSHG